jgi:hypothetical protein
MGAVRSGSKAVLGAVISVAAVLALVGCGTTTTTGSPSPSPTSPAASPSPIASPAPDTLGARAAALKIIVAIPGAQGVWGGCSQLGPNFSACPFTPGLITRLNTLTRSGYFGDAPPSGVCGENYITGTQNGLFAAPQIFSATANEDGSVTVVIKRGPPPPDLTATMTHVNGTWLASDLASGTGPSASIFSVKPNC